MQFIPIILGPTASGKTQLAVALAQRINGEIISADSRQVYRGMNIGTGKDYTEYVVDGQTIPCHLIDVLNAGEKYDVSQFQRGCLKAINEIQSRNKTPIICGGTGLYVEAILRDFETLNVPPNEVLREELSKKSREELREILDRVSPNNEVDVSTKKRIIRGIEVISSMTSDQVSKHALKKHQPHMYRIFCLDPPVELRRKKITKRLRQRIDNEGLIEEVESLLQSGLTREQLIYYGLEYKFITEYLQGKFTKVEFFERLNSAIHRFAKRQMTFFRSMEKRGLEVYWIDGDLGTEERLEYILPKL